MKIGLFELVFLKGLEFQQDIFNNITMVVFQFYILNLFHIYQPHNPIYTDLELGSFFLFTQADLLVLKWFILLEDQTLLLNFGSFLSFLSNEWWYMETIHGLVSSYQSDLDCSPNSLKYIHWFECMLYKTLKILCPWIDPRSPRSNMHFNKLLQTTDLQL